MLDALHAHGDAPELWTYAHGTTRSPLPYPIRRLRDIPRDRSLRSGPSVRKVLLDLQLAAQLALDRDRAPVIAHHVEAALSAWIARRPFTFFAHTDLASELPSYASPSFAAPLAHLGGAIDRSLIAAARHVAAVSPVLAAQLEQRYGRSVQYVPTPWAPLSPNTTAERNVARAVLGITQDAEIALYAGNLDAYQGWQDVVVAAALASRARASLRLVVATQSDPKPLRDLASQHGVAHRLTIAPLLTEVDRVHVHAAADIAVVPRRIPGGLPIKLLDALGRGVAIVTTQRAIAGLPLDRCVTLVKDDAPDAIAHALSTLMPQGARRQAQIEAGSAYLREHHSRAKFIAAFDAVRDG